MVIPRFPSLLLLALTASAASAHAQQGQQSKSRDSEIIVEGHKVRALVSDFVDRVLPVRAGSQFGRFEDAVCPKVVGLPDSVQKEIVNRMLAVGRAVDIEVKGSQCPTNLFLLVVRDKRKAVEGLRRSHPEYLEGVSRSFLDSALDSSRPYVAWQISEFYGADGMRIGHGSNMPRTSAGATERRGSYIDGDFARVTTTAPPSRMRANVKPHVMASIVLVEARALDNLDARQLADFAFMQAMLPLDFRNDEPPASSILSVLSVQPVPDEAPQSVTRSDVAFLKALRAARSDTYSLSQKNVIRGQMILELEKGAVDEN